MEEKTRKLQMDLCKKEKVIREIGSNCKTAMPLCIKQACG
jgi:hypothetical protein